MKALVTIFILFASISTALAEGVKSDLKYAATLKIYTSQCAGGSTANEIYERYLSDYMASSGLNREAALETIAGAEILAKASLSNGAKKAEFCQGVGKVISDLKAQTAKYRDSPPGMFDRRANFVLDSLLVGAIGALIGLAIGVLIKLVTKRNLMINGWWFPWWAICAIALSRALIAFT